MLTPSLWRVALGGLDDERVIALLREHLDAMHANSPPGSVYALGVDALRAPDVSFFTAWDGETLLGCGALRELAPRHGEIKSMRTARAHLRRGVAAAVLEHLVAVARERGYTTLSLETGTGPAFEPAIALYLRFGFTEGAPFGDYVPSAFNRFFHLAIMAR
jgi:putative acetyltransferase